MKFKFLLQLLWVMSVNALRILVINLIFISAMYAADDLNAQNVKSIKDVAIDLELNDSRLIEVFDVIESKTDFLFTYKYEDVNKNLKISGEFKNSSIADILMEVSKQSKLKFHQINDNIHVSKKHGRSDKNLLIDLNQEQGVTVTGSVISSEDNQPLPGANVIVKGTSRGTVTDVDGNYVLDVPSNESTLVFSSVGFVQEEVVVGDRSVINMTLTPDIQALEEIVVIGYGTQEKRDLTGAISSVTSKDIEEVSVTGFDQAIEGKLSGVRVMNANPSPGAGLEILIRGPNSIQSSTFPLIVIDGMPLPDDFNYENNPFNAINPNDIASIEVLKDASATAIYGTRASNGVILITTKKGKKGKAKINFSARYGMQQIARRVDLADRDQFLDYYWAGRNTGF